MSKLGKVGYSSGTGPSSDRHNLRTFRQDHQTV